jgi:lipopolysaccharide/colanic/teichoic acid biosynthesis glycosyltransferase
MGFKDRILFSRYAAMKRAFDFTFALAGLLALLPLLAAIALAVWMADRRSPFFFGLRVARGGGQFRMVKFRTMRPDAWKTGVNSTAAGDARVTPLGKRLRGAKLDELPQLWNVFKGDMSLVGPRPQVPADAGLYTAEERRMLIARPGITDLASVVFADEGEILAGSHDPDLLYNQIIRPWKSRLALLYVDRRSCSADLRIVALTALALVSRRRALDGVRRMLEDWGAGELTLRMASRREPLIAYPAPGASEVVTRYP